MKPGYKQTEVGVIPEEWNPVPIASVCELVVDCNNRTPPMVNGGFYAVVKTPNVRAGKFVREGLTFTDEEAYKKWTSRAVPQIGDVLITREAPLGEVCLVPNDYRVCLGQRMMLYRPAATKSSSSFLLFALMSDAVQKNLLKKIGGSTVGHAKVDDLRYLLIPLPPSLTEQRAIAAALSEVDALLAALDRLIAKKRDLKQAAMQQLLTGQTRLPGFEGEWVVKRLGEIGVFFKGSGVKKEEARSGPHPCIRYGEIYTKHNDVIAEFHSFISAEVASTAKSLKKGDVLFAGSGETKEDIGKCVAFVDEFEAYAGGDIVILRPHSADSRFLGYALNTPAINRQKASRGQGDAVVHIGSSALAEVAVNIPPLPEQTAIAAVLSDMDAELAALEQRREKTRALKQGMMQELLTGRTRLA